MTKRAQIPKDSQFRSGRNLDFFIQPSHRWGVASSSSSETPGETRELLIHDLSRGGAGVAREADGRVVFVPFTAPGDRVRVRILESEKRYAQAELVEVLEPSPSRAIPPCPVFGRCGGCQWQHLPYDLQWKTKFGGVRHALDRVQIPWPTDSTQFPAVHPFGYRNRIQLRGIGEKIGFFAPRSHDIIAIDGCPVTRDEINVGWEETRSLRPFDDKMYKVEVEVLGGGELRRMWNAPHAAGGFRQIHDDQNRKLKDWIATSLTPGRELLDLYGGSGNLSLDLVPRMARVDCVDTSSPTEARPVGTPTHFTFHRSPVLSWIMKRALQEPKLPKGMKSEGKDGRSAIVDPPREGLGRDFPEIFSSFDRLNVTELVAVGCDPDSWARDVSRFVRRGWRLERAAVLDFFPQTPHVESVALLRR